MKKNSRTEHDLKEALRISANTDELSASKAAYLERSGSVSVMRQSFGST